MSDRFDIALERKLETKPDGGDEEEPRGVRRIELITGHGRRREWSRSEKARILVESAEPGVNVSDVARRNGLSPQQLFAWRREARALFADASAAEAAPAKPSRSRSSTSTRSRSRVPAAQSFAQVMVVAPNAAPPAPTSPASEPSGSIEIMIGDAVVRIFGTVDALALDTVLAAVRRAS